MDCTTLEDREKLLIARSHFFGRVLLRALVNRSDDVAMDLYDYVTHHGDLKDMLDQHVKMLKTSKGKLTFPSRKRKGGKRRQIKNKERRKV